MTIQSIVEGPTDLVFRHPVYNPALSNVKEGDVIQIDFLDHAFKSDEVILMRAYGYVFKMEAEFIVLDTWHPTMRQKYADHREGCVDQYSILVSTIKAIKKMS